MRYAIPDDWELETGNWQCVQIQWPDSELWTRILISALSEYFKGRLWDETTGTITTAQLIGREIWARNEELTSCADCPDCPVCPDNERPVCGCSVFDGDNAIGEGDEIVPVQKISVDCTRKGLLVDYGGCDGECFVDLSCLLAKAGNGLPDDYTPPGGGAGNDEYSACGKAYAAVRAVMQMAESIWNHCDDLSLTPWAAIQDENPGIDIHKSPSGWLAQGFAFEGKLLPGVEWEDQADREQEYLCQALQFFTSTADNDLANDANWDGFCAVFRGSFVGNYYWGSYYDYIIGAGFSGGPGVLGRDQLEEIAQAGAADSSRDCDCPDATLSDIPAGMEWVVEWNFKDGDYTAGIELVNAAEIVSGLGLHSSAPDPNNGFENAYARFMPLQTGGKIYYSKAFYKVINPATNHVRIRPCGTGIENQGGSFVELPNLFVPEFPPVGTNRYNVAVIDQAGHPVTSNWIDASTESYLKQTAEPTLGDFIIERVVWAGTGANPFVAA